MSEPKKILRLSIKPIYLNQILSGRKTKEYRDIRPSLQKRYCELDSEGYCKTDANGSLIPREWDAIRFFCGKQTALVEITGAEITLFADKTGKLIEHQENGARYVAAQVIYSLGKILERNDGTK